MHDDFRNYTLNDFVWVNNKVKMSSAPLYMYNPRDKFET